MNIWIGNGINIKRNKNFIKLKIKKNYILFNLNKKLNYLFSFFIRIKQQAKSN